MRKVVFVCAIGLVVSACTNEFSLVFDVEAAAVPVDAPAATDVDVVLTADSVDATTPASVPPPTTSTTSTTTMPPRPITLGFAGDVQMIGSMAAREPLAAITELLSAPDLMFINLETVVAEAGEVGRPPIDKEFIFRSPPETLDQLVDAGVDVVGLANNHAWDYGPLGARVTRAHVDDSALLGTGAGADPAAAYAPIYVDVDGQTVGVVSLSRVPCDWSRDERAERPEIAWACDRFAIAAIGSIAASVAEADFTVVMLHGGTEITDCPDDELRRVIDVWVDLGVDVVSISHPHVLQGVEIVRGTPVLWSTGNFAFRNRGGRTGRSAVFEVVLGLDEPTIRVHPTVLPGGIAARAGFGPSLQVLAEVSDRSVGGHIGLDGVYVVDGEPSRCDRG